MLSARNGNALAGWCGMVFRASARCSFNCTGPMRRKAEERCAAACFPSTWTLPGRRNFSGSSRAIVGETESEGMRIRHPESRIDVICARLVCEAVYLGPLHRPGAGAGQLDYDIFPCGAGQSGER